MSASTGRDPRGEHTRAVHPPQQPPLQQRPVALPVHRTAAFAFDSAQEYADLLSGAQTGYSYSRVDNPTSAAFAAAVAALEGVGLDEEVVGQPFASGMAAISTVLMALTHAGAHVVAPREVYGGTYGLLTTVLDRFGVTHVLRRRHRPRGRARRAAAARRRSSTPRRWRTRR